MKTFAHTVAQAITHIHERARVEVTLGGSISRVGREKGCCDVPTNKNGLFYRQADKHRCNNNTIPANNRIYVRNVCIEMRQNQDAYTLETKYNCVECIWRPLRVNRPNGRHTYTHRYAHTRRSVFSTLCCDWFDANEEAHKNIENGTIATRADEREECSSKR